MPITSSDGPRPGSGGAEYALAFGQWGNKNVGLVLDAWARLQRDGGDPPPLVIVGLPEAERAKVRADATARGLGELVTVKPWLDPDEFRRQFTGASLVVFPSDYEGFGLPALEAMRLGIPVVVTPDPALFEVTGGLATVMDGWDAAALARAVPVARSLRAEDLERGVKHASAFTWGRTAATCEGRWWNVSTPPGSPEAEARGDALGYLVQPRSSSVRPMAGMSASMSLTRSSDSDNGFGSPLPRT